MQKRTVFRVVVIMAGLTIGVFSAQADGEPREQRILKDSVLRSLVAATQEKYDIECRTPEARDFQWFCLNGPNCIYHVAIDCIPQSDHFAGSDLALKVKVAGFDDGRQNDLTALEFEKYLRN